MDKNTLIKDLGILSECDLKRLSEKTGATTLGDLANLTLEEMYYTEENHYFLRFTDIRKLGRCLHKIGLTYKDEYEGTNIPVDLINRDHYCMTLPFTIQRGLKHTIDVQTLGELVTTPHTEILKARGIAEVSYNKLKRFLAEQGMTFKFPDSLELTPEEIPHQKPVVIIKKVVPQLPREEKTLSEEEILAQTVEKSQNENAAIAQRINRKKALLAELERLTIQRAELLMEEAKINKEIRAANRQVLQKVKVGENND